MMRASIHQYLATERRAIGQTYCATADGQGMSRVGPGEGFGGQRCPPRLLERRPGGSRGQSWRQAGGGASSIPTGPGVVRSTPGMHRLALGDSVARGSHGVDFSAAAR